MFAKDKISIDVESRRKESKKCFFIERVKKNNDYRVLIVFLIFLYFFSLSMRSTEKHSSFLFFSILSCLTRFSKKRCVNVCVCMYIPYRSFYLSEHVKETGKQKRIKKKKIIITTHMHAYKTQDQFFFHAKDNKYMLSCRNRSLSREYKRKKKR